MAPKANGRSIATIEGLSTNGELHYVQQAFKDNFALQCGYCTPGFIMATVDYLSSSPSNPPLRDEIKSAIKGNVCRCTGYEKIISAVSSAIISSEN
jgi:aerobic-type carbon monoxide dehydrogenase small subunit (CoxS/CutS family)